MTGRAGKGETTERVLRADAQRNRNALVAAGREVFAAGGVDAPFDDVAKRAGVGRATLYRNFPTREHLFAVLIEDQLDVLRHSALRAAPQAASDGRVIDEWLREYYTAGRRFGGVSAHIGRSLADPGSPMASACGPMRAAFADLIAEAQRAGVVRDDLTADAILALVGGLPTSLMSDPETGAPYLDVVLAGLRPA